MRKSILLVVLAILVSLPSCDAFGSSPKIDYPFYSADYYTEKTQDEILSVSEGATPSGSLRVCLDSELGGVLIPGLHSYTEADRQVQNLIHGYSTVTVTNEGKLIFDPVVIDRYRVFDNGDGSMTFTFLLNKNLCYSDGTSITAADYVFSVLLLASPEWNYFQSTLSNCHYDFVGYKSYHNGDIDYYPGVRLLGDYMFSLTTANYEDSTFFDIIKADVTPLPMSVIAPGVKLQDDGGGAYLSGDFTAELLSRTVFSDTGYAKNPRISSGPYILKSYSTQTQKAELYVNERFLGKYDGARPQIKNLTLSYSASGLSQLDKKSADLLLGVSGADLNSDTVQSLQRSDYPRYGFSKLQFICDRTETSSANVRRALAYLLRYDEIINTVAHGNANRLYSFYSTSMWETAYLGSSLADKLSIYSYDPKEAERLLIEDGWIYDIDGEPFEVGVDTVRCKRNADGKLVPLVLEWANTDTELTDYLYRTLLPDAYGVGMKINSTTMDFSALMSQMKLTDTEFDIFSIGYGFTDTPAYWYYYSYGQDNVGLNFNRLKSEALSTAAQNMKSVNIGDYDAWCDAYLEFLVEWNRQMPDVPIYEDVYADVYTDKLINYRPTDKFDFSEAIVRAYVK